MKNFGYYPKSNMDSDIAILDLMELHHIAYSSDIKGVTVKRFLHKCGVKRTAEKKVDGKWLTYVKILDIKKWTLAKIKYGF